jgi:hypothetical protein
MKLSMLRADAAVQAAMFGSWNRKPVATNVFKERGASGGGELGVGPGVGVGVGPAPGAGVGVGSGVGVGVGSAAGSDACSGVGVAVAGGVGSGVGTGVGVGSGVAVVSGEADGSAADAKPGMMVNVRPAPSRLVSSTRRKTAARMVVDVAGCRMAALTLEQPEPPRHHTNVPSWRR